MTCETLTIDGKQVVAEFPRDGCCPPSLCTIDWCGLICNFIRMLPNGPLWDKAKAYRMAHYLDHARAVNVHCGPEDCAEHPCITMVDHAIYTARRLLDGLFGALWPSLRESDPFTAHDTLDEWLLRLGWVDCFNCACRDPGMVGLSPIEIIGYDDGCVIPVCCAPDFPDDLVCAVKQGIVRALSRAQLGIIRNIDSINFVIAPLGAYVEPVGERSIPLDPKTCFPDDGTTLADCEVVAPAMRQFEFRICNSGDVIPKCVKIECPDISDRPAPAGAITVCSPAESPTVKAYYERTCTDPSGLPERIWPGVMAAECIVRSMMPAGARISLVRCC